MKLRALLLLCLALAGCNTVPNPRAWINAVIDLALPSDFTGYAKFDIRTPFAGMVHVEADGLKRGANGWNWVWLTYSREGSMFSGAKIVLGRPPIPAVLPPFSPPPPVP